MSLLPSLLWLLVLLVSTAGLSAASCAVLGLAAAELRVLDADFPGSARRVECLRAHPRSLLSALWIMSALLHVLLGASLWSLSSRLVPHHGPWGVGLLLFGWLMLCSQGMPMLCSGTRGLRLARRAALPLLVLSRTLSPFGLSLQRGVEALLRAAGAREPRVMTEAEFLTGVEVGGALGILRSEESGMVEGILDLENTEASEVMTPRVDLIGVAADAPAEDWVKVARSVRFRHLPVYRGSMDSIEGMLDTVRFLLDPGHDRKASVEQPLLVPESVALHELLVTLQQRGLRCAVVLDEYGGTAGVVTRGDILEEITADVTGEYAHEAPPIQGLGDHAWLVDGKTSLDDINDETGLELASGEADRIAGWVMEHSGCMLRVGETVEAQGCRATVRRLRKHRILQLQLNRIEPLVSVADRDGGAA